MLATKTLKAIDAAIARDGGARFRMLQRASLAACEDAYRGEEGKRTHLGASTIGRPCDRELWYSFVWAYAPTFDSRMLRLFNRGHLEEGRFIALMQMIGVIVWSQDRDGNQFRVADVHGHFGSAVDAVLRGVPDLPDEVVLGEFKTHSLKSFTKLQQQGVKESKPEHFAQIQVYLRKLGLGWALYLAVCKDDDNLYAELIPAEPQWGDYYIQRASFIIGSRTPPPRINESATWWQCSFCNFKPVCHGREPVARTCRSCVHAVPLSEKRWGCTRHAEILSTEKQLAACADYTQIVGMKK